jgi:hypothetical protein
MRSPLLLLPLCAVVPQTRPSGTPGKPHAITPHTYRYIYISLRYCISLRLKFLLSDWMLGTGSRFRGTVYEASLVSVAFEMTATNQQATTCELTQHAAECCAMPLSQGPSV